MEKPCPGGYSSSSVPVEYSLSGYAGHLPFWALYGDWGGCGGEMLKRVLER